MSSNTIRLLSLTLLLTQACAAQPGGRPDDAIGPEDLGSEDSALRVAASESSTYYALRHDFRRCAWPFCGGYWVREVNHDETTCADGTTASECYVTDLDLSALGLNERDRGELRGGIATALVRGEPGFATVEGRSIAVLNVSEAWRPLVEGEPVGDFFKIADNGIRCITTPCYTQEAAFLNHPWWFTLERLDVRGVGATDEQLAAAWEALGNEGLLVAGWARAVFLRHDVRLRIRAEQIYLPVRPSPAAPCDAQDARGVGMCEAFFGYAWDGGACVGLSGCSCEGADCGSTWGDPAECEAAHAMCGGVFCGGIAGFPCPGLGACVDNPYDSCDPASGGADCGGLCECNARQRCGPGWTFDPSPEVCACVEDAPITPCATVRCAAGTTCEVVDGSAYCVSDGTAACGSGTCGAGTVCCNASCGICTPPGGVCIQLACE